MKVAIIHLNGMTTLKLIFTDVEKNTLSKESDIEFVHTDDIELLDSTKFKEYALSLINEIEIQTEK